MLALGGCIQTCCPAQLSCKKLRAGELYLGHIALDPSLDAQASQVKCRPVNRCNCMNSALRMTKSESTGTAAAGIELFVLVLQTRLCATNGRTDMSESRFTRLRFAT